MSIELLQTLAWVAFIASGVFLVIAIVLFFLLDVPKLYGDVSGRTAQKAIEAIREQNEKSGNKAYRPSAVNAERGKITDKITQSGKIQPGTNGLPIGVGTEKLNTADLAFHSPETTLLEAEQTTLLPQQPASGQAVCVDVEMSFLASREIIE